MRQRIIHLHARTIEISRVGIGRYAFVVVSVGNHVVTKRADVATIHRQVERRTLAMVGDYERQAVDAVCCEIGTLWIYAEHTVGQLYRGERGYQEMADVADVGINVVNPSLAVTAGLSHSR